MNKVQFVCVEHGGGVGSAHSILLQPESHLLLNSYTPSYLISLCARVQRVCVCVCERQQQNVLQVKFVHWLGTRRFFASIFMTHCHGQQSEKFYGSLLFTFRERCVSKVILSLSPPEKKEASRQRKK
jgi:hypothetical protein